VETSQSFNDFSPVEVRSAIINRMATRHSREATRSRTKKSLRYGFDKSNYGATSAKKKSVSPLCFLPRQTLS